VRASKKSDTALTAHVIWDHRNGILDWRYQAKKLIDRIAGGLSPTRKYHFGNTSPQLLFNGYFRVVGNSP